MKWCALHLLLLLGICVLSVIALNDGVTGRKHALRRHQQHTSSATKEAQTRTCASENGKTKHHGAPGGSIFQQLHRTPDDIHIFLRASSYVSLFDANKDGVLDAEEVKTAVRFPWSNDEHAWLGQRVLRIPDAETLFDRLDKNKDGRITVEEMQSSFTYARKIHERDQKQIGRPAYRKRTECQQDMSRKLDQCKTSELLRCQGYVHFAEMQCTLGKDVSPVQQCFQQNACGDICGCVAKLESEEKQKYKIETQKTKGNAIEKRLIPIFFGLALTDIFLAVGTFGAALGAVSVQLLRQRADLVPRLSESAFLDPVVWSGTGSPPSCSMYLFWSTSCGAIWSGGARNCNPLGERVYGNSCKDHFRFGSRGCGFLGLGCQSLCWGTELSGCKCDLFNYDVHPDTLYPGHQIEVTHVGKVSECSDRCTARSDCVAFEIPPLTVDGRNIYNCFLKDGGDDPVQQIGTTTFTRIQRPTSAETNKCKVGRADFGQLPYGTDWSDRSLGDTFERRNHWSNRSMSERALSDKGKGRATSIRYRPIGLGPLLFLFYRSRTQQDSILNTPLMTNGNNAQWALDQASPVAYDASNPVQNLNGGGWTFAEAQVRVLNHHRRMMELGSALAFVDEARQTAEGQRQFPQAVRDIVANNDAQIYNNVAGTMLHINTNLQGSQPNRPVNSLLPLQDIRMPYDTNVDYTVDGGVGPIGLDAAFVLATQAAGINYENVHASAQAARGAGVGAGDYTATVVVGGSSRQAQSECITMDTDFTQAGSTSSLVRDYAVVYHDPTQAYNNNARAGYYFAFDVEPSAGSDERNVFVFAIHTADPRSYIIQSQGHNALANPSLTAWDLYRSGGSKKGSRAPPPRTNIKPTAKNLNPPGSSANTRALAHAHAGVVDRDLWLTWIQNGQVNGINGPPLYTQMHVLHIFLHPDDIDGSRLRYQNHGGANPSGLDDDPPAEKRAEKESYLTFNTLALVRSQLTTLAQNMLPINFGYRLYAKN